MKVRGYRQQEKEPIHLIEVEGESGTSDIKVAFNAECENANW
jgi:hypothetical protein